jgi:hypothetical protein
LARAAPGNRGSTGPGIGGGIKVATGGVADADVLTAIFGNYATASNDDLFGTLGRWKVGP